MKISIIGGGWLGQPLAETFSQLNHNVVVTKRLAQDAADLTNKGLAAIQFNLGTTPNSSDSKRLFNCGLLVLNIPPGRKSFQADSFIQNMCDLINLAKSSGTQRLLFISTTAVYGNDSRVVYEHSDTAPETESAKAHVKIEQYIQHVFAAQGTILRLSGLVAEDRHPAKFMSGRKQIENGQQVVNLIHRHDVIQAIVAVANKQACAQTYHLSALDHPSRADYYCAAARKFGIPLPEFSIPTSTAQGKQIHSQLSLDDLAMSLAYPSPYDML
ncbi:NAD-dependent epimerase/dehydratase family protein [Aliiglaciecola sp. LCG003]|uniref:NAD-dependent epimerase/dehydratase family protein n=1 Tax=Aliiglaciecola sp. LCG003 TaxID=3053655 RepID=UPI002572F7F7|nr:NAD-dependent epimerase/dehydratase family protein [Aliiglaciecola sp. LCG003]WJG09890.1 NAD-dependent epimerase/dehydratase family protein [Aliiglaciecola sp. LCG003]